MRLIGHRRRDPVRRGGGHGQALAEFALVFPIFIVVLFAIITFGLWAFYGQQLENAAREGARYAAVTSLTAQCPTSSRVDAGPLTPSTYAPCDTPADGWPGMTEAARSRVWGMPPTTVHVAACWSGYVDPSGMANAEPRAPNTFRDCTMGGIDPRKDTSSLECPEDDWVEPSDSARLMADGDDKASATAVYGTQHYPTTVTVYACTVWRPPLAGLLFVPPTVTLQAVVTEALQRQQ